MSILPPQNLLSLRHRHADIVTNIEDRMDSIRSATGLSSSTTTATDDASSRQKSKSGEEPLAGQKGEGTVEEPFDLGNKEGSEGAPPAKEGVSGVLGDAKRKAGEFVGKGS